MIKPVDLLQLRVSLQKVSPLIWRRLLVRSDSTIADLHHTLQIVMDWEDLHLYHFLIRGRRYGIGRIGAFGFREDAHQVRLERFGFSLREKFIYVYDYYDQWQLEIRVEARVPLDPQRRYPACVAGQRAAPPEECGGPWQFLALKQRYSLWAIGERLLEILEDENLAQNRVDYRDEVRTYLYWLNSEQFDRRAVDQRLQTFFHKGEKGQDHENSDQACC